MNSVLSVVMFVLLECYGLGAIVLVSCILGFVYLLDALYLLYVLLVIHVIHELRQL